MGRSTPDLAVAIARAVASAGGRAYIVGGWVRDELLGRTPKDLDLEVFGVPAERLRALLEPFGRVDAVGESFTVFKIGDVDVSLPRRESKIGRGHKGFAVHGDPHLSLDEAARRRDFTVNAISRDPLTGDILDPFDGRRDLADRVLRMVDRRTFGDDSLRVLRAVQFAARFELTLDADTAAVCRATPLDDLPAERIWGELEKLLLQAERPSIGLRLAWDLDVIRRLLPELVPLAGCPQDPEWHPEGDVWTHTLMVVDEARRRIDGLPRGPAAAMMLAALCHDVGKPATTAIIEGRLRSPGHEIAGVPATTALLDRLNIHTLDGYDVRRAVLGLVTEHMRPGAFQKSPTVTDGAFRRLAQKVDLELLARFAEADCRGRAGPFDCSAMAWFLERARSLGVEHRPPAPLVLGRHLVALGVDPGPRMGELLKRIYERQLDGEFTTTDEGIALARTLV
ncbi:MAG: HD domain-containing protein [Acidobacteria bacterium]|nr:HD domain-containing protein [Acidobacteriota bacterium]